MKNVIENKKEKTFTVQLPTGKTKVYKTRRGAEACATKNNISINIPGIVTANTYLWHTGGNASQRRRNEERYQGDIDDFARRVSVVPTIDVEGSFSQSCKNTYKTISYNVTKKGEMVKTNLTGLIGEAARWGITLVK